jgi:hypothetical protein
VVRIGVKFAVEAGSLRISEGQLEMLATLTVTGSPTIVGPGELVIPSGETAVFGDGGCSIGATLGVSS